VSKFSISYLLALMIVFQSFLAIADIHQTDASIELHQIAPQQHSMQAHNFEAHGLESDNFDQHDSSEQQNDNHVECHHGHCHHASVVFIIKTSALLALTRQNNQVNQAIPTFISPIISPDLRPPIS